MKTLSLLSLFLVFSLKVKAQNICFEKSECHSTKVSIYNAGSDTLIIPANKLEEEWYFARTLEFRRYNSFQGELLDKSFTRRFSEVVRKRSILRESSTEYIGDFHRTDSFKLSLLAFKDTLDSFVQACELWMCLLVENQIKQAVLMAETSNIYDDYFEQFSIVQSPAPFGSVSDTLITLFPFSQGYCFHLIMECSNKLSTNYPIVISKKGIISSEAIKNE